MDWGFTVCIRLSIYLASRSACARRRASSAPERMVRQRVPFLPGAEVLLSWSKIGQGYAGSEILGDQGSITIQSISMLAGMELHLPDGTRRTLCGVLNKAEAMRGETEGICRFTQEPGRFG